MIEFFKFLLIMYTWKRLYSDEILEKGKKEVENIINVKLDYPEITADIAGTDYQISAFIEYGSLCGFECGCPSNKPCEHEAAMNYYADEHPELLEDTADLKDIVNALDEKTLKEIVLDMLKNNVQLKESLLKTDKTYYLNKLSKILKTGLDPISEMYDIDYISNPLEEFLRKDISHLLNAGEYNLACELLIKITDILGDDIARCHDSWYDLSDICIQYTHSLCQSRFITSESQEKLVINMYNIEQFL